MRYSAEMTDWQQGEFVISTDKTRLDIATIHDFLSNRSYWALGRPREVTERAIENSLCFGIYKGAKLIGFARVISDFAVFAYIGDVFVLEEWRGRGLSK